MVTKVLAKIQYEKRDVPYLRGKIHYFTLCFYPLLLQNLKNQLLPQDIKQSIVIFFVCYMFNMVANTLLHNSQKYIYRSAYKRIDVASIFLISTVNSHPMGLYYARIDPMVAVVLGIEWCLAFLGVFGSLVYDFCCITKEIRSFLHLMVVVPSFYIVYKIASLGKYSALLSIFMAYVFQSIGVYAFIKETPILLPGVFGHHELFHVCCVIVFAFLVLANHLIISDPLQPFL